jgi:hypothetical protein
MGNKKSKKVMSKLLVFIFLFAFLACGVTFAKAQYIESTKTLAMDGFVESISSTGIILQKEDVDSETIAINKKTVFAGKIKLEDITPGDWVNVVARVDNGMAVAKVIKMENGAGYGIPGKSVMVQKAYVISKSKTFLTVATPISYITFQILPRTRFIGKSLAELKIGDTVMVIGKDTGTEILAKIVMYKKAKPNEHNDHNNSDDRKYDNKSDHDSKSKDKGKDRK